MKILPKRKSLAPAEAGRALATKRALFWLKLAISALILGLLLYFSVDPGQFWSSLLAIHPGWLLLSVGLFFPAQLLAAYRWQFLLRALGGPQPLRQVLHHNLLGQLSALFLPGQLSGDVVRTVLLARGSTGKAAVVVSVIVDKLAILAAIALTALAGGLIAPLWRDQTVLHAVSLLILIGSLFGMYLFTTGRALIGPLWGLVAKLPLPAVVKSRADQLLGGARVAAPVGLGAPLGALGLAVLFMLISALGSYTLLQAMSIPVGFWDWAVVGAVVAVVQLVPVSIGGLGIREGTVSVLLLRYGVQPAVATSFSLVGFVFSILLLWASWLVSAHYLQGGARQ